MFGALAVSIALIMTILVLWKKLMLFVLAAVGFWVSALAYFLTTYTHTPMLEQMVLAIAATVGGLFLFGMVGRQASETLDEDASPIRRAIHRMNGGIVASNRRHRETPEEYRGRVHSALHPRVQRR